MSKRTRRGMYANRTCRDAMSRGRMLEMGEIDRLEKEVVANGKIYADPEEKYLMGESFIYELSNGGGYAWEIQDYYRGERLECVYVCKTVDEALSCVYGVIMDFYFGK